jgi:DNA-3-methyladenine glycosylase
VVARALLGKRLVHGDRAGIIVETEAYQGPEDRASHARFGPTRRNQVMFGPGGVSYVYLCYGVHELFNVVAGPDGSPGAVLVRALEPHHGLPDDPGCARGPGKLTRALAISRDHNGVDLTASPRLTITHGRTVRPAQIAVGPRVGVDYAGDWAAAPLRFWVDGSPAVSKHPGQRPPRARSKR